MKNFSFYLQKYKNLSEPFWSQLLDLAIQLDDVKNALRKPPSEGEVERRKLEKLMEALEVKAFKVIKELSEEEKKAAIYKEALLKNSGEIGLDVVEATQRKDWELIAEMLAVKKLLEEICSIPDNQFHPIIEHRLDKMFERFVRLSCKLTFENPLPLLMQKVERLRKVVKQKNKKVTSNFILKLLNRFRKQKRDF